MRSRGGTIRGDNMCGGTDRGGTNRGGGFYRGRGHSNEDSSRDGRRPSRVITVPPEFHRQTLATERKRLTDEWKRDTGCEVVPLPDIAPHRVIITKFEVYGSGSNLDKAVEKVEEWIRYSVSKTPETTAWAKIQAYDRKNWLDEYTQREQDEQEKQFTKDMPEELKATFKSLVTFDWPNDLREANVTMKDAFGPTLEKLDSIRMEDQVFIVPVGMHQLEIRGSDINNAKSAEQHLRVLCEKAYAIWNNKAVYPKYKLLDLRESRKDGVVYERAEAWWPNRVTHPVAPRLLRCAIMHSATDYWQDLQPEQHLEIQSEIQRALDLARYEKGYYDLSIRVGCLALRKNISAIGTKQSWEDFLNDIITKQELDCVVKNWLVDDKGGDNLLARLVAAKHLLKPASPTTGVSCNMVPQTLAEMTWYPTLRGSWVFIDPNHTASNYVVQIHWMMDEDGLYEKAHLNFYRLASGRTAPKENLDIKLLELGEGKGWQFSLTSMDTVSAKIVPTALRQFAEQVKVKPRYDTASKARFVDFNVSSSLKLVTGRLDRIYTFDIAKTGYKLDCVCMWYPGMDEPCWGLNVYHNEWRTHLAELELLKTGECASWADSVSTFLPDDGYTSIEKDPRSNSPQVDQKCDPLPLDGIRILLVKLMELSQVLFQDDSARMPEYPAITPSPPTSAAY